MIQNDEAFLEGTGELWSSYIMDPKGDYATFVINPDGSYLTSADLSGWRKKIEEVNGVDETVMDEICSYISTYEKDGEEYYGYINLYKDKKTPEEIKELFDKYEIPYIKRAVSAEIEKTENFNGWSAYVYNKESKDDLVELDVGEFSPNKIKVVQENYNKAVHPGEEGENVFRYQLDAERVVSQQQDAQRGMTNIKIKYLFKNKKYYKYDGTQPTAYSIARDWDDILDIFAENNLVKKSNKNKQLEENVKFLGRVALRTVLFGVYPVKDNYDECEFTETLLDGYIDNIYYQNLNQLNKIDFKFARDFNNDGTADIASTNFKIGDKYKYNDKELKIDETTKLTYDPRNPNLISKVDINADALSAFSILENTHTASADYAYRDFKELIVELDYFDKEDLTKPATDILEWILPETSSAGWPIKSYDKYNDYGTMIHSKEMYENFDTLFSPYQEQYSDTGFSGFEKGQAIVSPATAKIIEMGTTTVTNEGTEQLFDAIYVVRDDDDSNAKSSGYVNKNSQSSNNDESAQKAFITEKEKEAIEKNGRALEEKEDNSFGKSYTTGYIKLEVIGKDSVDKILSVINDSNTKEGIKAFYEEYYNGKYDTSDKKTSINQICDSYTIYIEGIDFRKDQTTDPNDESSWKIENTILNEIIKNSNSSQANSSDIKDGKITLKDWAGSNVEKIIDNYTEKEIPKYYPEAKRKDMEEKEQKKVKMPSIFEFTSNIDGKEERQLYIKAGTLIGLCGDANIKIIMKDKDNSVVENVEEYLEIEDSNNKGGSKDSDWNMFFWLPFECGAIGTVGNGVDSQGSCSSGESGVGLVQWTILTSNGMNNIAGQMIPGCLEIDESFCSELKKFKDWNANDFWNDYLGSKEFQRALKTIAQKDREYFTSIQMELVKKNYLDPVIEKAEWVAERPACVQGILLHLNAFGTDWGTWINDYSSATDEEIILKAGNTIGSTNSTAGVQTDRAYNEPQIALEILSGKVTEEEIYQWIWNNDQSVFDFNFK